MVSTALIKIWDTLVGGIAWDQNTGIGSFEYEPAFLEKGWNISPLKMPIDQSKGRIFSFPELRDNQLFKGIPGMLADVLPDRYGKTLINVWLANNGRIPDSMNPVELLCYIGKRGMGALEFEPPIPNDSDNSERIELGQLIELTNKILSGRTDFKTNLLEGEEKALHDILKIGTSAGGARAKAIIAYNAQTGEIRSGQTTVADGFNHWLLKFDGISENHLGNTHSFGRVEMAYHYMAIDAGIEMTECKLLEENGRAHFMTRRFDRTDDNQKLHVQTFCAIQHIDFNEVNIFSYEQLFQTMRMLKLDYTQAEQVFRRMIFNVLSRNCDDHTKNFSFIMGKDGIWKISPAYDICYTYDKTNPWVSHQALSINGKRENFTRNDFKEFAAKMNIRKSESIINQVWDVVQNWSFYAKQTNVDATLANEIKNNHIKV